MSAAADTRLDIYSSASKADPFPVFARYRATEPVVRVALPDKTPGFLVTRYDDVTQLLKDPRFAKSRYNAMTPEQLKKQPWMPAMFKSVERNMLDLDPPDHTRLRDLVHKAFTPRLIEQMRARVQSLADELLDKVAKKGEMDLIRDYALPLPITIIAEILGVPTRDQHKFYKWSNVIVSGDLFKGGLRVLPAVFMFVRYVRGFFKARRADPKDDLGSALVAAEQAGDKLSEDELVAMVLILLVAGYETTVNLIGSGVLELLRHQGELDRLRAEPTLIKTAVEELLRFTSPVFLATERYAREDVTLHGVTIPRGNMAFGVIGSANRDESVFKDPDRLDIGRDPNKHLSFGLGVHYCLGAPLARLEAQIAIDTLLRRMPRLRLRSAPSTLKWRPSLILRGLEALPVLF